MSTDMSNKLSVREGLIRVETAERFQAKPEAGENVQVVVMQKTGKSLHHYVTLRTSNERLSIGEKFWGDYVCYIVDMSARRTKIDQEFVTRDHATKVRVTADISYKAIDGQYVAIGVDDALLTLREELITYLKREIGKLIIDQVTEEFLDGRIYQQGMALQNLTGLAINKVAVALEWPEEIVKIIKARKEQRRKQAEEDENRRRQAVIDDENRQRSQKLEKEDIDHVDILMDKLGLSSMPADMRLKMMALPRQQAYLEIAKFIDETRRQYQQIRLERDKQDDELLLRFMNDGTLEEMDLVDLGKKLLSRRLDARGKDNDMDMPSSVIFGNREAKRLTGSSSERKRLSNPITDTEED
jgi:hypothetical protein